MTSGINQKIKEQIPERQENKYAKDKEKDENKSSNWRTDPKLAFLEAHGG